MKFYKSSEIPIQSDDQVFKESPIVVGISFFVISVITLTALFLGIHRVAGVSIPRIVCFIVAAFAGLFGLIAFRTFRASLKTENWLLRCNGAGIIIHFRSFENWRLPAERVQAVGFEYSEIAWAGIVKERRTSPSLGGKGNQTEQLTFLHFCLANADTATLEEHLQQEQNLRPEGIMLTLDYPLQVLPGGMVELRWRGGISPSARKAIQYLSQYVKIADADSRKLDLTHQKNLPPGEEDRKILALAKGGDEMGAVELTRQIYGSSLSEAKDYVEKLRSGGSKNGHLGK